MCSGRVWTVGAAEGLAARRGADSGGGVGLMTQKFPSYRWKGLVGSGIPRKITPTDPLGSAICPYKFVFFGTAPILSAEIGAKGG